MANIGGCEVATAGGSDESSFVWVLHVRVICGYLHRGSQSTSNTGVLRDTACDVRSMETAALSSGTRREVVGTSSHRQRSAGRVLRSSERRRRDPSAQCSPCSALDCVLLSSFIASRRITGRLLGLGDSAIQSQARPRRERRSAL
jgi:hypothetical protein